MKQVLKFKRLLFILLIVLGVKAIGQDGPPNKPQDDATVNKATIEAPSKQEPALVFESQEAKDKKIALLESVIRDRLAQGKTEEDLKAHYETLEKVKKATIKNPENHEE